MSNIHISSVEEPDPPEGDYTEFLSLETVSVNTTVNILGKITRFKTKFSSPLVTEIFLVDGDMRHVKVTAFGDLPGADRENLREGRVLEVRNGVLQLYKNVRYVDVTNARSGCSLQVLETTDSRAVQLLEEIGDRRHIEIDKDISRPRVLKTMRELESSANGVGVFMVVNVGVRAVYPQTYRGCVTCTKKMAGSRCGKEHCPARSGSSKDFVNLKFVFEDPSNRCRRGVYATLFDSVGTLEIPMNDCRSKEKLDVFCRRYKTQQFSAVYIDVKSPDSWVVENLIPKMS